MLVSLAQDGVELNPNEPERAQGQLTSWAAVGTRLTPFRGGRWDGIGDAGMCCNTISGRSTASPASGNAVGRHLGASAGGLQTSRTTARPIPNFRRDRPLGFRFDPPHRRRFWEANTDALPPLMAGEDANVLPIIPLWAVCGSNRSRHRHRAQATATGLLGPSIKRKRRITSRMAGAVGEATWQAGRCRYQPAGWRQRPTFKGFARSLLSTGPGAFRGRREPGAPCWASAAGAGRGASIRLA